VPRNYFLSGNGTISAGRLPQVACSAPYRLPAILMTHRLARPTATATSTPSRQQQHADDDAHEQNVNHRGAPR